MWTNEWRQRSKGLNCNDWFQYTYDGSSNGCNVTINEDEKETEGCVTVEILIFENILPKVTMTRFPERVRGALNDIPVFLFLHWFEEGVRRKLEMDSFQCRERCPRFRFRLDYTLFDPDPESVRLVLGVRGQYPVFHDNFSRLVVLVHTQAFIRKELEALL